MTKQTLKYIAGIVSMMESNMLELNNDVLDILNITLEERQKIEDAIQVTMEKIYAIKQSKIADLEEHVEMDIIERITNK